MNTKSDGTGSLAKRLTDKTNYRSQLITKNAFSMEEFTRKDIIVAIDVDEERKCVHLKLDYKRPEGMGQIILLLSTRNTRQLGKEIAALESQPQSHLLPIWATWFTFDGKTVRALVRAKSKEEAIEKMRAWNPDIKLEKGNGPHYGAIVWETEVHYENDEKPQSRLLIEDKSLSKEFWRSEAIRLNKEREEAVAKIDEEISRSRVIEATAARRGPLSSYIRGLEFALRGLLKASPTASGAETK